MKTFLGIILVIAITLSVSFSMARYQAKIETRIVDVEKMINDIPESFGHWKRTGVEPLPDYATIQLKIKDAKVWYYTNTYTNDQVSVFVIVGPTGRLSVHTPEICLSGAEVTETTGRTSVTLSHENEQGKKIDNRFWKVSFNQPVAGNYQRMFYYAMGDGQKWYASENPRFEFSKHPIMTKIQVETVIPTRDNTKEDIVYRFLEEFIPEVEKTFGDLQL